MIFFKKKPYILDCFTYSDIAYQYAKINYSKNFFPDWWKKTKKNTSDNKTTIKMCKGFIDYFKYGIVIPSWFEIKIDVNKIENSSQTYFTWVSSNKDVKVTTHSIDQFHNFAGKNGRSIKIISPWYFSMNKDIKFVWTQPTWNLRELLPNFSVLPGVVDFKFQNETHINLFVEAEDEYERSFIIPPLTPLVMLYPMTEEKIEIKTHLISEQEYKKKFLIKDLYLDNIPEKYTKSETYYNIEKKLKTKIETLNKCPFHND